MSREMSPEQRYRNDASFKALVDTMEHFIGKAQYTPSEMRDAALLASIHYEMRHVRPIFVPTEAIDPRFFRGAGGAPRQEDGP